MPYGIIKIDTITFTDAGVDKSVSVSGLVQNPTFTGNVTATGTISGLIVQAPTVTGTTANFASGVYTTQISGAIVKVPAGSAGAPSIQVGVGASVAPGLYGAGTDLLGISTGGAGRIFIDSTGRLGVGTSSPGAKLEIYTTGTYGTAYQPAVYITNFSSGGTLSANTGLGAIAWATDSNSTITSSIEAIRENPSAGVASALVLRTGSSGGGTERLRIDSSGRVGIGSIPSTSILTVTKTGGSADASLILSSGGPGDPSTVDPSIQFAASGAESPGTTKIYSTGTIGVRALCFATGTDTAGTERMRIDSFGRLLVGSSTARSLYGQTGVLQTEGTGYASSGVNIILNNASTAGPLLMLGKSRGSVNGSNTIVQNGDTLGEIYFCGADGTDLDTPGAGIRAVVDGAPGSNDMPGRLEFSTTADGASTPTERMRITSTGAVNIANAPNIGNLNVKGGDTIQIGFQPTSTSSFYHQMGSWDTGTGNFAIVHSSGTGVQLIGSGANTWSSFSDARLKDVVGNFEEAIDAVKTLEPIRFTWKSDDDKKPCVGISAQSIQAVLPEAVDESPLFVDAEKEDADRETYLTVRYTDVIPLLTAALQEAITKIETLEAKVAALEGA
jgi:hypothetical protein